MGTSKSFSEVNHSMIPNWSKLSSSLTKSCDSSELPPEKLQGIMQNFVKAVGGAATGGRGGSRAGGRSSLRSAQRIGGFFADFLESRNLSQALEKIGLVDLTGKTVHDVINHLINYCSGDATSIDDNAAKEATRLLFEELMDQATTIDELEKFLDQTFDERSLEEIIVKYFAYYINELLSRWFYEKLIKDKSEHDCSNLFSQIKDFIVEKVKDVHKKTPLHDIDWSSERATELIQNIQQDVLTVFE